jgi:hypothetical protein
MNQSILLLFLVSFVLLFFCCHIWLVGHGQNLMYELYYYASPAGSDVMYAMLTARSDAMYATLGADVIYTCWTTSYEPCVYHVYCLPSSATLLLDMLCAWILFDFLVPFVWVPVSLECEVIPGICSCLCYVFKVQKAPTVVPPLPWIK